MHAKLEELKLKKKKKKQKQNLSDEINNISHDIKYANKLHDCFNLLMRFSTFCLHTIFLFPLGKGLLKRVP